MGDARSITSGFYVMVTGQIDGCQMQGYDNLYVKYSFNKGHDWSVLAVRMNAMQLEHEIKWGTFADFSCCFVD
jgi:hypothetical protein